MAKDVRDAALEMFLKSVEGEPQAEAVSPQPAVNAPASPAGEPGPLTPDAADRLMPATTAPIKSVPLNPPSPAEGYAVPAHIGDAAAEVPEASVPGALGAASVNNKSLTGMKTVSGIRTASPQYRTKVAAPVARSMAAGDGSLSPAGPRVAAPAPVVAGASESNASSAGQGHSPSAGSPAGPVMYARGAGADKKGGNGLLVVAIGSNVLLLILVIVLTIIVGLLKVDMAKQSKDLREIKTLAEKASQSAEKAHASARLKFSAVQDASGKLNGIFLNAEGPGSSFRYTQAELKMRADKND